MNAPLKSPNFQFLADHDPQLLEYAARAERYVLDDPNTALIKLRQLAEDLAEDAAAYNGVALEPQADFTDILRELGRRDIITREMADIFHGIRKAGNAAAHDGAGTRQDAVSQLKLAHRLAIWFHRAFRDPGFKPGPFLLPPAPAGVAPEVKAEMDRLRKARWEAEREADETEDALQRAHRDREAAERRANAIYAELEAALTLAEESETRHADLSRRHTETVARLKAEASAASEEEIAARNLRARSAAAEFDLTEGEARARIDAQLRAQGWEADSIVRTWAHGARPQAGRNMAIAFVPTAAGHADYVLYAGRTAAGVIEAKRQNLDLCAALEEAAIHSRAYRPEDGQEHDGNAKGEAGVPHLFASNGRPFKGWGDRLHGIWYRNSQTDTAARVIQDWPAPGELLDMR
jgi:type I restriction enzyme R subunit